jgi:hypothetical protein
VRFAGEDDSKASVASVARMSEAISGTAESKAAFFNAQIRYRYPYREL